MRQTVKYARVRAIQDSDRTTDNPGTHYGNNVPGINSLPTERFFPTFFAWRTTRGSIVRAGE